MQISKTVLGGAGRAAVLTLLATSLASQAQQTPKLDLRADLGVPSNPFAAARVDDAGSSSSSPEAGMTERFSPGDAAEGGMQPPPRRRYGRPRYTDNMHNPDGSNKYTFLVGGGFTLPTGGTHNYAKTNLNFQGGIGRNFSRKIGVIAQFDYAKFGIQTAALTSLLAEYNREIAAYNVTAPANQQVSALTQLGGGSHIWSLALNPIYNIGGSDSTTGAYVTGGVGFYHKYTEFTTPSVGTTCDYYYGCYQYQANQAIDSYTSNAFGANAGVGFTYKPSRFANERFYAEARYVFSDNKPRPFYNGVTGTQLTPTYFNVFPQGSARTTFIPVTVGIRF